MASGEVSRRKRAGATYQWRYAVRVQIEQLQSSTPSIGPSTSRRTAPQ